MVVTSRLWPRIRGVPNREMGSRGAAADDPKAEGVDMLCDGVAKALASGRM